VRPGGLVQLHPSMSEWPSAAHGAVALRDEQRQQL
jgi:hypothetical protein